MRGGGYGGRKRLAALGAAALLLCGSAVPVRPAAGAEAEAGGVELSAERSVYDRDQNRVTAAGSVVVRKGQDELRADEVVVDLGTQQAEATGHVRFVRPGMEWTGERFAYNFKTREWQSGQFDSFVPPFHVRAEQAEGLGGDTMLLHGATATTCELEHPGTHYSLRAREMSVVPGDRLTARGTVLRLGRVPVLYSPYWYRSLSDSNMGLSIQPGYRSRMGGYLLTSYAYGLSETVEGETHVDYRSRRGVAGGQDLTWKGAGGRSKVSAYFIDDQGIEDDDYPEAAEIEESRYRFRYRGDHRLAESVTFKSELNYLSDEYLLEDFFRRDYRRSHQPRNDAAVTWSGRSDAVSLLGRTQLNDFYTVVQRLPELNHEHFLTPVGESGLFYESASSASALTKRRAASDEDDDYSVFRLDSLHTVYYPTRHFGFLNLTPRAGARGTYYSKTRESETVEEVTVTTTTNAPAGGGDPQIVTTVETNSVTRDLDAGSAVRGLFELGFETSYKAFKIIDPWPHDNAPGLRHVVEPYANYTYVPVPTVEADELYRFDGVDQLGEDHHVKFGVRNKLQRKRDGQPHDLVDLDLFSTYRFAPEGDDDGLGDLGFDGEFRPADPVSIDFDGTYDREEAEIRQFNTRIGLLLGADWQLGGEYRYTVDESSLVAASLRFEPNTRWSFEAYGRYEMEDSRLEEHAYEVQRTLDCLAFVLGVNHTPSYTQSDGTEREDEWLARVEVWLTAFPDIRMGAARRD